MIPKPDEFAEEWRYIYEERLGILCEDKPPTAAQTEIARKEADEHVRQLRGELLL